MNESELQDRQRQLVALYDTVAPRYGRVGPDGFGWIGSELVDFLAPKAAERLLDVGCGRGAVLSHAAARVSMGIGIDISTGMIHALQAELATERDLHALVMDGERLGFADRSFDVLASSLAIFCFPHPATLLEEWRRVLRPRGRVGISVAAASDPQWQWYNALLSQTASRLHLRLSWDLPALRRTDDIAAALTNAGFVDVHRRTIERTFTYGSYSEWWDNRWTHGARLPLAQLSDVQLEALQDTVFGELTARFPSGQPEERLSIALLGATNP
jgi:ubiquinone/menaquinone biosynthesis C-methylase UbiE